MNFTDTGTLLNWSPHNVCVIPELYDMGVGHFRGGAFLCIPNFENLTPPFSVKHGEYRMTPNNQQSPNKKILSGDSWGSVRVTTTWNEMIENTKATLSASVTIQSLSDKTFLRPGFHPYFVVDGSSHITIEDTHLSVESLPHDVMKAYPVKDIAVPITMSTKTFSGTMSCAVTSTSTTLEEMRLSYCAWTDNKNEYVCIEPVLGGVHGDDNLPAPITLMNNESITLRS